MATLRIATRNSPLALWQAEYIKRRLLEVHAQLNVEIIGMTTQGDVLLDRSLATAGGKGLFLKELEVSLLNGETDIAVHSMKDVPVTLPDGLEIPTVCMREEPRDAFVSNRYQNLYALPDGAKVGTSSLRRVSQLLSAFPKLEFVALRGNVNTRLGKLDDDEYDAIILAAAGLKRLGFEHRIKQLITPELCLPAVGQGIVGIECRSDDVDTKALIEPLHDLESAMVLAAERGMNAALDGGCQVPVAGFAEISKGRLRMRGMVASVDGEKIIYSNQTIEQLSVEYAQRLGTEVGKELLDQGAAKLLAAVTGKTPVAAYVERPVVLLTRQQRYRGNVSELLMQLDCEVENIETLQIDPLVNDKLIEHLRNLDQFTDVLFVSRNAVEIGMALLKDENVAIPESVNVMTVGAETAKQLRAFGISALFPNRGTGADALLGVSKLKELTGRKILIFRGTHGLAWPAEEMRTRGAVVEHADVYKQSTPAGGLRQFREMFKRHERIDAVFIHSAQSMTNFMHFVRDDLHRFVDGRLIVGSERIGDVARQLGWLHEINVAQSPSNKHMLMAFTANQKHTG